MITMCDSQDDEHAPFPHRLVRPVTTYVHYNKQLKTRIVEDKICRFVFVICAACDHWIARPAGRCECHLNCHDKS